METRLNAGFCFVFKTIIYLLVNNIYSSGISWILLKIINKIRS